MYKYFNISFIKWFSLQQHNHVKLFFHKILVPHIDLFEAFHPIYAIPIKITELITARYRGLYVCYSHTNR